jgi:hypothetical protein
LGNKSKAILFTATVNQVRTLADGGIRIVLDLAENETETAKLLMDCKALSANLNIAAIPVGLPENEKE